MLTSIWSFFSSVVNGALNFVFRLSIIKFVVFGALSLVLAPLMELLLSLVDTTGIDGIPSLVSALPADLRFYLGVFRFDFGLPIIVGAVLVKFFIRRLPVVG